MQVAAFTAPDTADSTGEFSAEINWGDNSSSSGTIQEVSPGMFEVLGSHNYAAAGEYVISVTVSQGWETMAAAAEKNAEGEAGTDQVTILGPKVVPGNSMYTYTIVNPRLASNKDQLESLTISPANGSKAEAYDYDVEPVKGQPTRLTVLVYFYNNPGNLIITAKFKSYPRPTTYKVTVVQITITNPAGGSFTHGTPTNDPNPTKTMPNLTFPYYMKGLSSSTGENQAGFGWKANVKMSGGGGGSLTVGFIQHVSVQELYGAYDLGGGKESYLHSGMQGHSPSYLDVVNYPGLSRNPPFYASITPSTELPDGFVVPGGVTRPMITTKSATIASFDTPEAAVPWALNYAKAKTPADLKGFAQQIVFKFVFTLDIVATINAGPYAGTYWPEATVQWVFQGNQKLDSMQGGSLPWKGKGKESVMPLTNTWQIVGTNYFFLFPSAEQEQNLPLAQKYWANTVYGQAAYYPGKK